MSYTFAAAITLLATLAAAVGSWRVGHAVSLKARQHYHDVGLPIFAQLGLLLSVLIAFVFNGVWEEYRAANAAMNLERSELHGAAMLAHALPEQRGMPVERAIVTYADDVATKEWPLMKARKLSERAQHDFDDIIGQATLIAAASPGRAQTTGQILTLVMAAHDQRETRTYQLVQSVPGFIWVTLVVLTLLQIGFVVFAGVERPMHLLFAAVFTGTTVLVLISIRLLDFPFEGALALDNGDFVELSQQVNRLLADQHAPRLRE